MPQRAPANFDPVAEVYDETRDKLSTAELQALIRELEGSRTLEIAVGTGRLAKPLQDRGIDIIGIDVSARMLSRAKSKGTEGLIRGEVTHLPVKDKAVDNVLAVHFLHLVPDWPTMLGEVTRVATKHLVSLDTRTISPIRPRELYLQRLEGRGFTPSIKPQGELLLAEKVRPRKMDLVEKASDVQDMDKMLNMLEKKWLAVTWGVPDSLHKEVIDELRSELAGRKVDLTYENFLLIWRVDDLAKAVPYL